MLKKLFIHFGILKSDSKIKEEKELEIIENAINEIDYWFKILFLEFNDNNVLSIKSLNAYGICLIQVKFIEIKNNIYHFNIEITTSRPGIIIGLRGSHINAIKENVINPVEKLVNDKYFESKIDIKLIDFNPFKITPMYNIY